MNKLNAVFLAFVLVMPLLVSTVIVIGSNSKAPVVTLANTSEEENETEESFDTFLTFYLSDFFNKFPNKPLLLTNFVLEKRTNTLLREVFSPPPEIA